MRKSIILSFTALALLIANALAQAETPTEEVPAQRAPADCANQHDTKVQQKKDIIIEQASKAWCDRFPKWCIKPPVVVVIKESTSKVPCEGVTASK